MKRNLWMAGVALLLCISLSGCGGVDAGGSDPEAAKEDKTEPSGGMEIVETVKNAMLASERLTGGSYFVLESSTIWKAEESYNNYFAGEYAALPGLKKLPIPAVRWSCLL